MLNFVYIMYYIVFACSRVCHGSYILPYNIFRYKYSTKGLAFFRTISVTLVLSQVKFYFQRKSLSLK